MIRNTIFLDFWRGLTLSAALHRLRPVTLAEAAREYRSLSLEQRARMAGAA